jgi:hypothetical protein
LNVRYCREISRGEAENSGSHAVEVKKNAGITTGEKYFGRLDGTKIQAVMLPK